VRPDLDVDVLEDRLRLLRRKLVRDRPARRARDEAEPLLPVEPVDLVDDAVDVVAEIGALALDVVVEREQLLGRVAEPPERIRREAPTLERRVDLALARARELRHLSPGVSEEAQRTLARDVGIELAQRARRGVARIREQRLAGGGLALVHSGEVGVAHVDLAAYLEHVGHAGRVRRDVVERLEIARDVLALEAIAARGTQHEAAALVSKRGGEAVDLRLGRHCDPLLGRQP